MPRILFVSGFHESTRAKDLAQEFEHFGRLVRCDIPVPKGGYKGSTYAFVEYKSDSDASAAYSSMHEKVFEGNRLRIQWARSPPSSAWRVGDGPKPPPPSSRTSGGGNDRSPRRRSRSPPPRRNPDERYSRREPERHSNDDRERRRSRSRDRGHHDRRGDRDQDRHQRDHGVSDRSRGTRDSARRSPHRNDEERYKSRNDRSPGPAPRRRSPVSRRVDERGDARKRDGTPDRAITPPRPTQRRNR